MKPALPDAVSRHLTGLRHVGVVTEDLEATVRRLQTIFGIDEADILRVGEPGDGQPSRFAFLTIGGTPYELIEPVSAPMRALLLATPAGANHVCYNVDDLDAAVAAMAGAGVRLGHVTPDGILDMPHARMAYFDPADTGGLLIEFVEPRA